MLHSYNPSTWEVEGDIGLQANLIYIESCRHPRLHCNLSPLQKKKKGKNNNSKIKTEKHKLGSSCTNFTGESSR